MGRLHYLWIVLLAFPIASQTPTIADLPIRLQTSISTETAKSGDSVDAVVIAGAYQGSVVHGRVEGSSRAGTDQRATLLLAFTNLGASRRETALSARVMEVDNARESVDQQGCIQGILASETISGRLDERIDQVGEKYSGVADIISAVKSAMMNRASTEIALPAGTEMTIRLSQPLATPASLPHPRSISDRAALRSLRAIIDAGPFQTMALHPRKPSDITNILFVGDEDTLRRAFAASGWALAASLTPRTRFETLLAMAEDRGYAEAPVSLLTLGDKPPDLVFEKTTDTFARRHHLRVWRRPSTIRGAAVWVAAGTHDVEISFSDADRMFIHRIDPQVDREREKVASDLFFAGHVRSAVLLARPQVPHRLQNAIGDPIETDGSIQVLILH
ncbi:MAG TPA: LssY C-terminal domain-containing protein [Verrucomicrobiae bacterium]|nr:LssY C-terminal domain-containing protein [Verrucomicrobiae bacterium]